MKKIKLMRINIHNSDKKAARNDTAVFCNFFFLWYSSKILNNFIYSKRSIIVSIINKIDEKYKNKNN